MGKVGDDDTPTTRMYIRSLKRLGILSSAHAIVEYIRTIPVVPGQWVSYRDRRIGPEMTAQPQQDDIDDDDDDEDADSIPLRTEEERLRARQQEEKKISLGPNGKTSTYPVTVPVLMADVLLHSALLCCAAWASSSSLARSLQRRFAARWFAAAAAAALFSRSLARSLIQHDGDYHLLACLTAMHALFDWESCHQASSCKLRDGIFPIDCHFPGPSIPSRHGNDHHQLVSHPNEEDLLHFPLWCPAWTSFR
ncbi:uncharacterized protein K489DRAFT_369344 [Dissoconium aciculare CBS 342.82]|uniref:Uncharacterized protein n=1 Tax=Dissoconium aciculare CBS 342.82 TaxID=1314786 RepID=A0A6J3M9E6_9PEZI|nr:uncharacterized protein K489DRAFT_369344 [Dissoconium aciculare CBS 342.82]KAF1824478.1 hypothetical protein K489DRAFT_369344 [Dissoconium aciculare CBS 342.82]